VVAVSSGLHAAALKRLEELEVDRVVAFVEAPFADHVHRLASGRS
jgi:hypothetical protein